MSDPQEFIGKKFLMLTVVEIVMVGRKALARCRCECGNETTQELHCVNRSRVRSCGCARPKALGTHGPIHHPLYRVWKGMIRRCLSPTRKSYLSYGGRGITVCKEWMNLEAFARDMGPRPSERHTIERIRNNGNYEPGNCRWATVKEQNNNKSTTRFITYKGETLPLAIWAERIGVNTRTLWQRLFRMKWPIEKAMTHQPIKRALTTTPTTHPTP